MVNQPASMYHYHSVLAKQLLRDEYETCWWLRSSSTRLASSDWSSTCAFTAPQDSRDHSHVSPAACHLYTFTGRVITRIVSAANSARCELFLHTSWHSVVCVSVYWSWLWALQDNDQTYRDAVWTIERSVLGGDQGRSQEFHWGGINFN